MNMSQDIDWSVGSTQISKYFTAAEVTQKDPDRYPANGSDEEASILRLAVELDKVREAWGSSIGVTSWFRPYWVNRAVGGVSSSQHLFGSAADIFSHDGRDDEFENFLDRHWGGGLGFGVASGRGFTHLDLRGGGFGWGPGDIRWAY